MLHASEVVNVNALHTTVGKTIAPLIKTATLNVGLRRILKAKSPRRILRLYILQANIFDILCQKFWSNGILKSWDHKRFKNREYFYLHYFGSGQPQTYRVEPSRTTTEIKDLVAGRSYEAWVTASTRRGEGGASRRFSRSPPAHRGKLVTFSNVEQNWVTSVESYYKLL